MKKKILFAIPAMFVLVFAVNASAADGKAVTLPSESTACKVIRRLRSGGAVFPFSRI